MKLFAIYSWYICMGYAKLKLVLQKDTNPPSYCHQTYVILFICLLPMIESPFRITAYRLYSLVLSVNLEDDLLSDLCRSLFSYLFIHLSYFSARRI